MICLLFVNQGKHQTSQSAEKEAGSFAAYSNS